MLFREGGSLPFATQDCTWLKMSSPLSFPFFFFLRERRYTIVDSEGDTNTNGIRTAKP